MKQLILALTLLLGACATTPPIDLLPAAATVADRALPGPSTIADRTAADEQASIGVELSYKAFRTALEIGTDAGAFKGKRALVVAEIDDRVFAAVKAVRSAYRTANSPTFLASAEEARTTIEQALTALKG